MRRFTRWRSSRRICQLHGWRAAMKTTGAGFNCSMLAWYQHFKVKFSYHHQYVHPSLKTHLKNNNSETNKNSLASRQNSFSLATICCIFSTHRNKNVQQVDFFLLARYDGMFEKKLKKKSPIKLQQFTFHTQKNRVQY